MQNHTISPCSLLSALLPTDGLLPARLCPGVPWESATRAKVFHLAGRRFWLLGAAARGAVR